MIRCWSCGVERANTGKCRVCGESATPPDGQAPAQPPEEAKPQRTPAQALHDEIAAARALLAMLPDLLGDDNVSQQLQHDTIEGETKLHEVMEIAVGRIMEVQILADGIRAAQGKLATRLARLEGQEQSLRAAILVGMDVAQLPRNRMELPFATVVRKSVPERLEIEDESAIPSEYFKAREPILDRTALKAAVKTPGANIPGARMVDGGFTIQISTR